MSTTAQSVQPTYFEYIASSSGRISPTQDTSVAKPLHSPDMSTMAMYVASPILVLIAALMLVAAVKIFKRK